MHIKKLLRKTYIHFRKYPLRYILGLAALALIVLFVWMVFPRAVSFSYANDNCRSDLMLLPSVVKPQDNPDFALDVKDEIRLFGLPIAANTACVRALSSPESKSATIMVGLRAYTVAAAAAPEVSVSALNRPIPASKPLKFDLSSVDRVYDYSLQADGKSVTCSAKDNALECPVRELNVPQGEMREFELTRSFESRDSKSIAKKEVQILPATSVVTVSVSDDQVVYAKPREFSFELDKNIATARATLLRIDESGDAKIDTTLSIEGKVIRLALTGEDDLQREAQYRLELNSVEALDGSGLNEERVIKFSLSGGPKVSSVNVGHHSVEQGSLILITFDQPLLGGQDVVKYAKVEGIPATITQRGDRIIGIQLGAASRCANFSIKINKGLLSEHEIAGTVDWSFASRLMCRTSEVIGYSVQRRPIMAYTYGGGSTSYLFTGAIHGNELSSRITMHAWMNDLEANHHKIPAGVRIVIVPEVSPDGVARRDRLNTNQVNLNRNFPTHNWTSDIMTGTGEQAGGGGSSAGSEPETQALMALTGRLSPRLVVTHHSLGSLVNSNDVGIAISAGQDYARIARYRFIPNSATTATFGFEMTGTYEDWLLERGTPGILIELDTHTGNHYTRNQAALWAMIGK